MDIIKRLEKIKTPEDVEDQLRKAKKYVTMMRGKVIHKEMLEGKVSAKAKVKEAEKTLRLLRRLSFDIDDALEEGKPAISVLEDVFL